MNLSPHLRRCPAPFLTRLHAVALRSPLKPASVKLTTQAQVFHTMATAMAQPCRFFQQGRCNRGDSCQFSHSTGTLPPAAQMTRSTPGQPFLNPAAKPYVEVARLTRELMGTSLNTPVETTTHRPRCRFYNGRPGSCRYGDTCQYMHDLVPATADLEEEEEESGPVEHFRRDLGGSVVQFEDGAGVSKISFAKDFSAIRMTGLPTDIVSATVAELLASIGHRCSPQSIRIVPGENGEKRAADILVEDRTFARSVCKTISLNPSDAFALIDAKEVTPSLSTAASGRRVERRKVQCSWFKPSRRAWLTFGSERAASNVCKKFSKKTYSFRDSMATCAQPRQNAPTGLLRNGRATWTVVLSDLALSVDEAEIRRAINSQQDKPREISVGPPTYTYDGEDACAIVLSLLSAQGKIEWSQANIQLPGKRAKAVARYTTEEDAVAAEKQLDNKPLSFAEDIKLNAQLLSTARFRVKAAVYHVVRERIRATSSKWDDQGLKLKFYPVDPSSQSRIVRIEGHSTENVAKAKAELERILDGDILLADDGKPLWSSSLQTQSSLWADLRQIGRDHKTIVMSDRRRKQLRAVGTPEQTEKTRLAIIERLSARRADDKAILLSPEEFRWASTGGFKDVVDILGNGAATFDVVEKRIITNGSDRDFEIIARMVKERRSNSKSESDDSTELCPVCFTEPESQIQLSCKHGYCGECFENMCAAAGSGDVPLPMRCQGNEGACGKVFSLEELQKALSSSAFEDLLDASFALFVRQHPQDFGYCPKPDCDSIYRKAVGGGMHTCTSCFTVVCLSCNVQHDGKTCAEYIDESTGGHEATARTKKQLGIKDCPRCGTSIEKTEGCNHMTCGGCKSHLCWHCLEVFPSSELCYRHLSARHGGIFDDAAVYAH